MAMTRRATKTLTIPLVTMIRDFPQIQGGQQISIFIINLLASLNLSEKTKFTKSDYARHNTQLIASKRDGIEVVGFLAWFAHFTNIGSSALPLLRR